MNKVYITRTSSFFPNKKVDNDSIELYLGKLGEKSSRLKNIILRQNGITSRYYALDKNQNVTHSTADMVAEAINSLFDSNADKMKVQLLACATSIPDQGLPSQASMNHGQAFEHSLELYSLTGVCLSSIAALKTVYMAIAGGFANDAVCTASELVSPLLLSRFFLKEYDCLKEMEENPILAFDKDFLRFMLSDGAAALHIKDKPDLNYQSLSIDWIEMISYANQHPACMYMGATGQDDKSIIGWKNYNPQEIVNNSIWAVKQDVKLLNQFIITRFADAVEQAMDKHNVNGNEIRYIIPHISSMYFYDKLDAEFNSRNLNLPTEKWYTNLTWVGNIGSVAAFAALDELLNTKPLKSGDRIMILVPESGRFSFGVVHLSVV